MTTTTPIPGPASVPPAVPSALSAQLAALLRLHHADALFPALLAMIGPHITLAPRVGTPTGPVVMNAAAARRLARTLVRYHAGELIGDILEAIEPYLPVLPPPVPARPGRLATLGEAARLSTREREVLTGMANGKSNGDIGRVLFLSEDTVKTHARRLFRKLGARDRAHAVSLAYRAGILVVGDAADRESA